MSSKTKPREAEPNFEGAMDRLEKIVEQMESGKLALEDLIVRYEEGMKLVKVCQERLASAEQKIEIIARDGGGKPVVKNFEPEAASKSDTGILAETEKESDTDEVRLFKKKNSQAFARRHWVAGRYKEVARTGPAATCAGSSRQTDRGAVANGRSSRPESRRRGT